MAAHNLRTPFYFTFILARFIIGMHKFCFCRKVFRTSRRRSPQLYIYHIIIIFSVAAVAAFAFIPFCRFSRYRLPPTCLALPFCHIFSAALSLSRVFFSVCLCVLNAHFTLNNCHEKRLKWSQFRFSFSRHCNSAISIIVCYNSRRNVKISFCLPLSWLVVAQLPTFPCRLCVCVCVCVFVPLVATLWGMHKIRIWRSCHSRLLFPLAVSLPALSYFNSKN